MIAITHLVFALLLLSWVHPDRNEAFAVLLFGVFIDIDHLIGMVQFVDEVGWTNSLDYRAAMASDIQWKSLFHSAESILLVGPVALGFRFMLPLMAWGAHLVLDYMQINYLGVMSGAELVLLLGMTIMLLYRELNERRLVVPGMKLPQLLTWETGRLMYWIAPRPILTFFKRMIGPLRTSE